jgi:hypothetical protein
MDGLREDGNEFSSTRKQGVSWPSEQLSALQEWLSTLELLYESK